MAIRLPVARRTAAVDAILSVLNAGGSVEIRSGAQPATADDAASGTLLATIALAVPAFGGGVNGVATLGATPALTGTGVAAGTAGWFRAKTTGGATAMDGSVSVAGGGGDVTLATTTVSIGLTVRLTAGTVTMPAG